MKAEKPSEQQLEALKTILVSIVTLVKHSFDHEDTQFKQSLMLYYEEFKAANCFLGVTRVTQVFNDKGWDLSNWAEFNAKALQNCMRGHLTHPNDKDYIDGIMKLSLVLIGFIDFTLTNNRKEKGQ